MNKDITMKLFYIPILFLLLIGCSHTYEVSKYYSEEDLNKDFNKSAPSKELKVVLTNDSSFNVFKGVIVNDTMLLNYNSLSTIKSIPLSTINEVSYKNHWKGIVPGFLLGVIVGGTLGTTGLLGKPKEGGINPRFDQFTATIGGALLGVIVGSVVGYIIGYKYHFQFNPLIE